MFQNWFKFSLLKCAGSALKSSETQIRCSLYAGKFGSKLHWQLEFVIAWELF